MKVLLYTCGESIVKKSGIGIAIKHQEKALISSGIEYTKDVSKDYDIVQINTVFLRSLIMSYISRLRGKKVVYYAHSTMEDFKNSFNGSNLIAPLFKKWISLCYNSGDIVITPTEYSKKLLESYKTIRKPIINLSNGIDVDFYSNNKSLNGFRKKFNIDMDKKVVISVGHFIERKGIIDFVELAKKNPNYEFYWFGETPSSLITKNVRVAINTELDNLHFPGYVNKEDLKDVYRNSDLFLFLTYEETEGIVILEALASKLPILVRDIPVYEDWLKDGVNVYKASSFDEFNYKLNEILNGKCDDLTKNGLDLAKTRDIKNIGDRLKEIYTNLLIRG